MNMRIAGIILVFNLVVAVPAVFGQGKDIKLPAPAQAVNVDVMKALQNRRSIRSFSNKEVSLQDLSSVLWAGNGINRPDGKRTAPAGRGRDLIDIYVIGQNGIYRYDPKGQALVFISNENIKANAAGQKFAQDACYILALIAKSDGVSQKEQAQFAPITAGAVAQNIYLVSGSLGLGTCYMAGANEAVLRKNLKLKETEAPLCILPLGYPAQ
jgi:SagB-type dehydrogenase family enzyme